MSNKCVIKYNENGGVDGVDIKNPSYFPQTEIENVKLELSNRQIAEKQASEKAKRAIEHVNSETAKTRTSKAVWESVAETWAKENDFWIEDYEEGHSYATQGGEHIVYTEDGNTETIRKVNHDIDDLSDWYKNLLDFNQLFPNTGYEIVGFTRLKKNYYAEGSYNKGIGAKGNFSVVVKQNFIPNKQIITQEEIQNYLEYLGFERMGTSNDYQQGDIILGDMNVDNVIKDRDGNYHVIDAYVEIEESSKYLDLKGNEIKGNPIVYNSEVGEITYIEKEGQMEMVKNKPTSNNVMVLEDEIINSPLYESLKQNPLLTEEQALEIYKQSFSVQLEDWDTLDLNC